MGNQYNQYYKPSNHMGLAIVGTIFAFLTSFIFTIEFTGIDAMLVALGIIATLVSLFFGAVAISKASHVNRLFYTGSHQKAIQVSEATKRYGDSLFFIGVFMIIAFFAFFAKYEKEIDVQMAQMDKEEYIEQIKATNLECPIEVEGTGITMTSGALEGNYMVTNYKCDENMIDMDALEVSFNVENVAEAKLNALKKLKEEDAESYKLYKKAGVGIIFKYVETQSNKEVTLKIEPNEL